jgi:hypothetical protein
MTRWEFIKIVTGFYNPSEGNIELPYTDIESPELRSNLETAYSLGLISAQERFRPNDPITHGEAKTILLRSEWINDNTNLFSSETSHISREKGVIIILWWMNNSGVE